MIRAILADDEQKSISTLEMLLQEGCPEIQVIATATNALEAVTKILTEKPDVVFLDVQMPGYNGFDVLEQIRSLGPIVVFTTAHKDYAISALRKGAFDFLLKPVDIEELRVCCAAVKTRLMQQKNDHSSIIELSVKDGIIFIKPEQIIRVEAAGSYTVFYLEQNVRHMVSKSMKEYEVQLAPSLFYRCHNSHIVNLRKVVKFIHHNGYYAEMENGAVVEISRKNKEQFLEKLKRA